MINIAAFDGWRSFRSSSLLLPVIMVLACVILWGALFARIADRQIGIDKDWLTLYLCGIETVHPALHEQQIDLVKNIVSASGGDQVVYRATLRANYCDNYPFTSLSMYLAGKWQTYFGVSPAEDFAGFLSRVLRSGTTVSGELLGILCLLVAFAIAQGPVRLSLFVAFGAAALFYLTLSPPSVTWMFYQATPIPPAMVVNWLNILGVGLHSWLNPGAAYSPFSVFPRCLCAILSFAAFAIRWSDRPGKAYWAPLLISVVHQSSAVILLVALVCCDLVIRPRVFRRMSHIVPIGAVLLVIFFRERMFSILGFSPSEGVVAVAILFGLALVVAALRPLRATVQAVWSFIAKWRSRTVEGVPLPFADALILFAMWFVILLISYFVSRNDAWYRVVYFWSELSPRYVGMFQLSVGAGLIYPLIAMLRSARPSTESAVAAAVAILMLTGAAFQFAQPQIGLAPTIIAAQGYEASSLRKDVYTGSVRPETRDETAWYYLMVRNAILGDRSISSFFGKT